MKKPYPASPADKTARRPVIGICWRRYAGECTDDVDYVRVYIRYLRRKIEPNPTRP